jgi:hypothetical protein
LSYVGFDDKVSIPTIANLLVNKLTGIPTLKIAVDGVFLLQLT